MTLLPGNVPQGWASLRGTLGIVLVAKKRGLIPSARVVMEDLIQAGLYLSRRGLDDALRRVDE
jgi:predicted nucleic acid-binding protein